MPPPRPKKNDAFNNLNNRAIALVSASSVVTTIAGLYAKDLISKGITGSRAAVGIFLLLGLIALMICIWTCVIRVLRPSGRLLFGNNRITNNDPPLTSPQDVNVVRWSEYREVLSTLQNRNASKADGLNLAYMFFAVAILAGSIAFGIVLVPIAFS